MYSYKTKKQPKNTIEIVLSIPKSDVKEEKELAFTRLQKDLTVEGFRKGKVPSSIAKKHLANDVIYQELIRGMLPQIYSDILKKEGFKPVINPKVELVKAKEGEDWEIKITIAEKPVITLGDYKKKVKEAKDKAKKADIWTPGKTKEEPKKSDDTSKVMNVVLEAVLSEVKVEISDLVIDEELNYRLARLVDDIQKIGMTTDSYLKSKNITMDTLKASSRKEIEDTYKLEFILSEIAEKENIKVEQADIDKLFVNIKDEKEKQKATENSYYYATIIRKQKTLDYLISL